MSREHLDRALAWLTDLGIEKEPNDVRMKAARAEIVAYLAAVPAPPVGPPREPTEAMVQAGYYEYESRHYLIDQLPAIWRAMYDAAPAAEPTDTFVREAEDQLRAVKARLHEHVIGKRAAKTAGEIIDDVIAKLPERNDELTFQYRALAYLSKDHAAPAAEPVAQQPPPTRDWTEDAAHENGTYQSMCVHCGETFFGLKGRVVCKRCAASCTPPSARVPRCESRLLLLRIRPRRISE